MDQVKLALVELVTGLYPSEYKGDIYYNQLNIKSMNMYKLREEKIAVCQQKQDISDINIGELKENAQI